MEYDSRLLDEFTCTCFAIGWFFPATPIYQEEESGQCGDQQQVRMADEANRDHKEPMPYGIAPVIPPEQAHE